MCASTAIPESLTGDSQCYTSTENCVGLGSNRCTTLYIDLTAPLEITERKIQGCNPCAFVLFYNLGIRISNMCVHTRV